jgi:Rrf2 family protein
MLSNSCRYGIRAVIYIASQPSENGKTGIKQISKDLNLPTPFLAKILQQLAKQKILNSSKGPHGGFSLMKDPRKITLLDIIRTIDGEDLFTNCVIHNRPCTSIDQQKDLCPVHEEYSVIRTNLIEILSSKTIQDMVIRVHDTEEITL